jgi:hypothetical protein
MDVVEEEVVAAGAEMARSALRGQVPLSRELLRSCAVRLVCWVRRYRTHWTPAVEVARQLERPGHFRARRVATRERC